MERTIIFVGADQNQTDKLGRELETHHFIAQTSKTLQIVETHLESMSVAAVLIDLDNVILSNADIRKFKKANPKVALLAISGEPFHPELQESMRSHIFACVSKPVDPEELIFLLNGALENNASPFNS